MRVQSKPSKRKQFSSEFKREAVRLVTEGGLSIAQAARDLGLTTIWSAAGRKKPSKTANGLFPVKAIPKTKNCPGCGVRTKCCAKSGDSKKSHQHLLNTGPVTREMRYQFVQEHEGQFRRTILLRMLGVCASAFYYWQSGP